MLREVPRNRYIVRNECFGQTVYSVSALRHEYRSHGEGESVFGMDTGQLVDNYANEPFHDFPDLLYAPVRVYVDLTLGCNLRCSTCLNCSGIPLVDELSAAQLCRVVEGIRSNCVFDVRFSGGEPTLKEGWQEICLCAKACGLVFSLNSNGVLSRTSLDGLIAIAPDEVSISLDGGRAVHDFLRGNGVFDKAVGTIQALNAAGCRVTINCAVSKLIADNDIETLLCIADAHCKDISFFHMRPLGRARELRQFILDFDELDACMRRIESLKRQCKYTVVRTRSRSLHLNMIDYETYCKYGLAVGGPDGFTRLNVLSNGDVFAGGCVPYVGENASEEFRLGNIVEEEYSLLNIWRDNQKLKEIRRWSSSLYERCAECGQFKYRCHGFSLEMELQGHGREERNRFCRFCAKSEVAKPYC
jgi:MoaA/NifB/PqqE/SkfB family radical SAM enzyme